MVELGPGALQGMAMGGLASGELGLKVFDETFEFLDSYGSGFS
jgi:hypothetical protein